MLNKLKNHINDRLPFLKEGRLLIAISGGIDSVVLSHLCSKLKLNIALAHCNFNLRGAESDADEEFVLELSEDLDVEVFIEGFDTIEYAKANKLSTQMAARELRYDWFNALAAQLHFDYILTAHHADDNLETFLINLSRGTGLDGLTGIPEVNENIVRPLLPFSRDAIEAYASDNKIKWREDASNASTKYLRNKLRHDVIPILKNINPTLLPNFNKTIGYLQDSKDLIDDRIDEVSNVIIDDVNENHISFNIQEVNKLNNPKAYLFEFLKDYNFTEWQDVFDLLDAQSGKQVFSKTHRLIKDRDCLLLSTMTSEDKKEIVINDISKEVEIPLGTLFFDVANEVTKVNDTAIYVDLDLLKFPLKVRKWEDGDYFYPFGMVGKKKLSKFFKDEKLSLLNKENTLLLCSEDNIVWVIGKRADNRFKVNKNAKRILKIELK